MKHPFGAQQKSYQQPSKTSIAIQEWVYGLKLNMCQSSFYKYRRTCRFVMKEKFQSAHALIDPVCRCWDEHRIS